MVHIVEAIYEQGVLCPVQPLAGIAEHSGVKVTVELEERLHHPLIDCIGSLPDEDAEEMMRIIEDEFEKVDVNDWR